MKGYDLAVCHSADIPGQEAAIRNHLAWITVSYCPGFIKNGLRSPAPDAESGRFTEYATLGNCRMVDTEAG